jgi:hypothetical protein
VAIGEPMSGSVTSAHALARRRKRPYGDPCHVTNACSHYEPFLSPGRVFPNSLRAGATEPSATSVRSNSSPRWAGQPRDVPSALAALPRKTAAANNRR